MTNLFKKFAELKGAKFVGINGYTNKQGETSNQVINCNVNIENAKRADLVTLLAFPASKLNDIANEVGATKEQALMALEQLVESSKKNLSKDERTAQSEAQSDAYTQLGTGLKFHNETGDLYVSGFANNKTVLVEGEYKAVKSSPKTLVKKAIQKTLKMSKYRSFKLSDVGTSTNITVTGSTVQL